MKTPSKSAWLLGSAIAFALSFPVFSTEPPATNRAPASDQEQTKGLDAPATALKGYVSPWLKEVLKLTDAGMEEMVLQAFIDGAGTFNLTTEQIIQLKESALPGGIISAMLQHDAELSAGLRPPPPPPPNTAIDKRLKAPPSPAKPTSTGTTIATATATATTKAEPDTIVNQSPAGTAGPAPDLFDLPSYDLAPEDPASDVAEHWPTLPEQYTVVKHSTSPVRKPFPVQLTSPILVFRTAGRIPNHVLLESFP